MVQTRSTLHRKIVVPHSEKDGRQIRNTVSLAFRLGRSRQAMMVDQSPEQMRKTMLDLEELEEMLRIEEEEKSYVSSSSSYDNDETTLSYDDLSSDYTDYESEDELTERNEAELAGQGRVFFDLYRNEYFRHISRDSLSEEDRLRVWYSDDEYLAFSNEIVALSIKISRGTLIRENNQQTVRGIEGKADEESRKRHQRRKELMQAVLGEYEKQSWDGEHDDEKIAILSHRNSKESRMEARTRAREDELAVRSLWKDEEELGKWTTDCCSDTPPGPMKRKASLNASDILDIDLEDSSKLLESPVRSRSPMSIASF